MHGVGVDLVEIDRVERALARRPRLAERLFSERERAYAAARARPGQHLAARFCAKEAVTKALGLDVLRPLEIEVLRGPQGAPAVRLHGAAAARAAELGVELHLSLTHSRTTAAAFAVAA
ncbi:MAG TPA: holo-ACP synthase [Solirubrobacteraceae bacterium]|nr:holo-ACP synthase [Solirubrobacteraceae bacterium]